MTAEPPAQVAAMLRRLRGVADEIVVAADSRVDVGLLDAYDGVADRVVRFDFRPPVDRPRAWLADQCSGDWLLSIDGDEVPGAELVEALPELLVAGDVVQYWLPRRWLFPDTAGWLGELPWWPDFQLRLLRNDATRAARAEPHAGFVAVLPARHVTAPLYHLDCVVNDAEVRAAKARRYEAEMPGLRAYGGGQLNAVLYAPERWAATGPRPVPAADRAILDDVLAARARGLAAAAAAGPAGPEPATASPRLAPDEEIDARASSRSLVEGDYRVALSLLDGDGDGDGDGDSDGDGGDSGPPRVRLTPGEHRPLYVTVENQGGAVWPWGLDQHPQLRVSYHWRGPDGRIVVHDGHRSPLPCPIPPGEPTIVPTWVEAPASPGQYLLEIDLVHEHVRWFESPLTVPVLVADRAAAAPQAAPASPTVHAPPPAASPATDPEAASC
jgi:hypothetical protein